MVGPMVGPILLVLPQLANWQEGVGSSGCPGFVGLRQCLAMDAARAEFLQKTLVARLRQHGPRPGSSIEACVAVSWAAIIISDVHVSAFSQRKCSVFMRLTPAQSLHD